MKADTKSRNATSEQHRPADPLSEAEILLRHGKYKEASDLCSALTRRAHAKEKRATAYSIKGRSALELKKYRTAKRLLLKAKKLNSADLPTLLALGRCYEEIAQASTLPFIRNRAKENQKQLWEWAYSKHPSNALVCIKLAETAIEDQNWARAENLLKPVADEDPKNALVHHLTAQVLRNQGRPKEANAYLARYVEENPSINALTILANECFNSGEYHRAKLYFEILESEDLDDDTLTLVNFFLPLARKCADLARLSNGYQERTDKLVDDLAKADAIILRQSTIRQLTNTYADVIRLVESNESALNERVRQLTEQHIQDFNCLKETIISKTPEVEDPTRFDDIAAALPEFRRNMTILATLAAQEQVIVVDNALRQASKSLQRRLWLWRGIVFASSTLIRGVELIAIIGIADSVYGVFRPGGFLGLGIVQYVPENLHAAASIALGLLWILIVFLSEKFRKKLLSYSVSKLRSSLRDLLQQLGRSLFGAEHDVSLLESVFPLPNEYRSDEELLRYISDLSRSPTYRSFAIFLLLQRGERPILDRPQVREMVDKYAELDDRDHELASYLKLLAVASGNSSFMSAVAKKSLAVLDSDNDDVEEQRWMTAVLAALQLNGEQEALKLLRQLWLADGGGTSIFRYSIADVLKSWPDESGVAALLDLVFEESDTHHFHERFSYLSKAPFSNSNLQLLANYVAQVERDSLETIDLIQVLLERPDNAAQQVGRSLLGDLADRDFVVLAHAMILHDQTATLRELARDQSLPWAARLFVGAKLAEKFGALEETIVVELAGSSPELSRLDSLTRTCLFYALGDVGTSTSMTLVEECFLSSGSEDLYCVSPLIGFARIGKEGVDRISELSGKETVPSTHREAARLSLLALIKSSDADWELLQTRLVGDSMKPLELIYFIRDLLKAHAINDGSDVIRQSVIERLAQVARSDRFSDNVRSVAGSLFDGFEDTIRMERAARDGYV